MGGIFSDGLVADVNFLHGVQRQQNMKIELYQLTVHAFEPIHTQQTY